jgi:hypothetical protein
MAAGDNNPRVFAETITLDTWRSAFDGERGEADLHIDVVFAEGGRVGGAGSPVRFRLSLRRAEVRVVQDSESIIEIKPSSVRRAPRPEPAKAHSVTERKAKVEAGVEAEVSAKAANLSARGKADGSLMVTNTLEQTESVPPMEVTHWKTENGYGFKIEANRSKHLKGQPWEADKPMMAIRDTNPKRKRGEPPEVRVEIHCLREDLVIEDVRFADSSYPSWARLGRRKQIAVEQYIKDELARAGLPCGDLSDPFTRIVMADAMPAVDQP